MRNSETGAFASGVALIVEAQKKSERESQRRSILACAMLDWALAGVYPCPSNGAMTSGAFWRQRQRIWMATATTTTTTTTSSLFLPHFCLFSLLSPFHPWAPDAVAWGWFSFSCLTVSRSSFERRSTSIHRSCVLCCMYGQQALSPLPSYLEHH